MNRVGPRIQYQKYFFWLLLLFVAVSAPIRRPIADTKSLKAIERGAPQSSKTLGTSKKTNARYYVVVAPETYVYENPDLDSAAFALLPQGTRIPVSRGTRGEYAKFFRTRFKGRLGWILTMDVKPEAVVRKAIADSKTKPPPKGPFAVQEESSERDLKRPFVFSQSVSFVSGLSHFRESLEGVSQFAELPVYGIRVSGPDVILTGPIVDFGLLLHYGAPSYYKKLSSTNPNGFLLWTEALLMMPLRIRETFWLGAGVGPVLALSSIQSTRGLDTIDSFDSRIGVAVSLSGNFRLENFLIRADFRYLWVNESYPQASIGIGTIF
jgi:hypothetical protein